MHLLYRPDRNPGTNLNLINPPVFMAIVRQRLMQRCWRILEPVWKQTALREYSCVLLLHCLIFSLKISVFFSAIEFLSLLLWSYFPSLFSPRFHIVLYATVSVHLFRFRYPEAESSDGYFETFPSLKTLRKMVIRSLILKWPSLSKQEKKWASSATKEFLCHEKMVMMAS